MSENKSDKQLETLKAQADKTKDPKIKAAIEDKIKALNTDIKK